MNKELTESHSGHETPDTELLQLIYDVARQKLEDQFDLIGKLDAKSGGVIALDAGILAFASTWSISDPSRWIVIAGLVFLLTSLCASCLAVFARRLRVLPEMVKIYKTHQSDETQIRLLNHLAEKLTKNVEHNAHIVMKKLTCTNIAIVLSVVGFLLIGIAHVVKIILL